MAHSFSAAAKGAAVAAGMAAVLAGIQVEGQNRSSKMRATSTGDSGGSRVSTGGSSGHGGGPSVDVGQVTTPGVMTTAEAGRGEYSPGWWVDFQNQIPEVLSNGNTPSYQSPRYSGAITPMGFDSPFFVPSLAFGALSLAARSAVRGVSVIGPRATYRQFAKRIGANYLNVTDEAWTMQKNMNFLSGVVKREDNVIFAGKFNPTKLNPKSVLAKEIYYLQKNGYKWTDNYSKLIKQ